MSMIQSPVAARGTGLAPFVARGGLLVTNQSVSRRLAIATAHAQSARSKTAGASVGSAQLGQRMISKETTLGCRRRRRAHQGDLSGSSESWRDPPPCPPDRADKTSGRPDSDTPRRAIRPGRRGAATPQADQAMPYEPIPSFKRSPEAGPEHSELTRSGSAADILRSNVDNQKSVLICCGAPPNTALRFA